MPINGNGRGRAATEGLNCTLTSACPHAMRAFCMGLRAFDPLFERTDFKISDGEPAHALFKRLTMRRTEELVAYGLGRERAPSLLSSSARHVEAHQYHRLMEDPEAVVIDVRNAYETDIGRMVPPEGGATLLDPKMRNSREFPKWLHSTEAKEQLAGKKVLMYCTGGIRCERASALLSQMEKASSGEFATQGISMVQGGIDRYLKTFPDGGHWRGKNYLFDRREEQTSVAQVDVVGKAAGAAAGEDERAREIRPACVACGMACDTYKGDFKCVGNGCGVPVIVCERCASGGKRGLGELRCPLCLRGHDLRALPMPDLARQKRAVAAARGSGKKRKGGDSERAAQREAKRLAKERRAPSRRVFVGRVPLTAEADAVRAALGGAKGALVEWLLDRDTSLFYGSVFCHFATRAAASAVVDRVAVDGANIGGRALRVAYAIDGEPPADRPPPRPPVPAVPGPAA